MTYRYKYLSGCAFGSLCGYWLEILGKKKLSAFLHSLSPKLRREICFQQAKCLNSRSKSKNWADHKVMKNQIKSVWDDFVQPMFRRPDRVQFAALCYDSVGKEKQILLITSRGTGRWILPKGWPIAGLESPEAALQEAWEEAGVLRGKTSPKPLGSYGYDKILPGDWSVPVRTTVYPVRVLELSDDYPEADQRARRWVSPAEAAEMVDEPELKELLACF